MTNLAPLEFERLWAVVREHMAANWNVGRERRCTYQPKDLLFMTLAVLKNCGKWDVVAAVFRVKAPTFQKMISKFIAVLSPFLYETFVDQNLQKYAMRKLVLSGQAFDHHPFARYATDVTFQQTNMPAGRMQERSLYYSAKHHLHGYKVEVSVLPNGLAVNCTNHYPGSEADVDIFRDNSDFHVQALQKVESDRELPDDGPLRAEYPNHWAVLADKGYQGLAHDYRAITPFKKKPMQTLTLEEMEANDRIAHDRVLVENFFGRLCSLWAVCADKYRWDEGNYDLLFKACLALTNYHIRLRPLRREDGDNYARYLQCLRTSKNMDKVRESMRTFPTAWSTVVCSDLAQDEQKFKEITDIHLLNRILAANMGADKTMSFHQRAVASQLPLGKTRQSYMQFLGTAVAGKPAQVKDQWEILRLLSSFELLLMSTCPFVFESQEWLKYLAGQSDPVIPNTEGQFLSDATILHLLRSRLGHLLMTKLCELVPTSVILASIQALGANDLSPNDLPMVSLEYLSPEMRADTEN